MKPRIIIILIGILLVFGWANLAQAFGISPPFIKEAHLLPGSHLEKTIYLIQSEAKNDYKAELSFSPEIQKIQNWISINEENNFTIPAGVKQFPLNIKIDVPQDAKIGEYKGYIWVSGVREGTEHVANIGGGSIQIALNVTNEEYSDWQLRGLKIKDLLKGEKNIQVYLKIENLGNIKIRPSKVQLDVYDTWHKDLLASVENKNLPYIPSFQTKEIIVKLPVNLKNNQQYWGEIKIYKDNALLLADKRRINVGEIPTINKDDKVNIESKKAKSEIGSNFAFLKSRAIFYALLGTILLIGMGFGVKRLKKSGLILEVKLKKKKVNKKSAKTIKNKKEKKHKQKL